jgi:hypothetical protein
MLDLSRAGLAPTLNLIYCLYFFSAHNLSCYTAFCRVEPPRSGTPLVMTSSALKNPSQIAMVFGGHRTQFFHRCIVQWFWWIPQRARDPPYSILFLNAAYGLCIKVSFHMAAKLTARMIPNV